MSSDNSAQKWVIGCLIAGFVAVLLCGGLVAGVGLLGYRAARQIAQEAMPVVQEYAELMAFAQAWTPPSADANGDSLIPKTIGPWSLTGEDEMAAIPELAIARNGWHGTYESSGTKIDVYVYQVPAGEQSQGLALVNDAVVQLDQATQQNAALVEESAAAAESLKEQAKAPLLNPAEMANPDKATVVEKVRLSTFAPRFKEVYGPTAFADVLFHVPWGTAAGQVGFGFDKLARERPDEN